LSSLEGLKAEIQVRTASQHIWASASHILQYKKEAHVPLPLRRSINRAAALLETVDLEFERVLAEREEYKVEVGNKKEDLPLNTESLRAVLDSALPMQNREANERYGELLDDLAQFKITATDQLRNLISQHLKAALESDANYVKRNLAGAKKQGVEPTDRLRRGVFFTHVGLAREILSEAFGSKWSDYNVAAYRERLKRSHAS